MAQKNDFCPPMLSALLNANSILLCTHAQPDGDAIGSTLAMGLGLRALGKQVAFLDADPVPGQMRFLPGAEDFVQPEAVQGKAFDAALAIDTATVELLEGGKEGVIGQLNNNIPVHVTATHSSPVSPPPYMVGMAEIELDKPDREFPVPPWLGREVSHEPRFRNSRLVRHPYSEWTDEEKQ